MGHNAEFRFDPGPLDVSTVERLARAMWSDLAFDTAALAALKRDGLLLDSVRLTGPMPYAITVSLDGWVRIGVGDHADAEALLSLWQLHFLRGLRPSILAA